MGVVCYHPDTNRTWWITCNKMKTKEAVTIIVFVTALACTFQTSFAAVNGMSCNTTSDCTPNAQCSSSVCQCMSGYKDSGSDTCILVYNSTCAADDGCSNLPDSVCTGPTDTKQCKCKSGYKYVEATPTCVKVYNSTCAADSECSNLPDSVCTGPTDTKQCKCKSGYKYVEATLQCDIVSSSVLWQPSYLLLAIAMLMVILGIEI